MRLRAKNILFIFFIAFPLCFWSQKAKFDAYTIEATKNKHDNFPLAKLYCDSAMSIALSANDNTMIAEAFVISCNVYVHVRNNLHCLNLWLCKPVVWVRFRYAQCSSVVLEILDCGMRLHVDSRIVEQRIVSEVAEPKSRFRTNA